jgi:aryl-alcohol dehydrogenase-like predicted oxidoreductase
MNSGRFLLGYGQESADGHSTSVIRAALGWELHVGPVAVTPMIGYDKMEHSTATMAGIAIGKGF